ncbi:MAG TPA: hypothetical protein DCE80_16645, partial [Ignavibacteriales bacterium]|nr:hypothetical protein [Ignavibacteriales bacterium]
MDVFERIAKAIAEQKPQSILNFGNYVIIDRVKKPSQQGMVVKVTNSIGKEFAIKFYRPVGQDAKILKDGKKRFISEVNILARLRHRNIVSVHTGGKAMWDENEDKWKIVEGLRDEDAEDNNHILFYLMDFIEGQDVSAIFFDLKIKTDDKLCTDLVRSYEKLHLFEEMIAQVCAAMNYYHSEKITHKDIKPDNIRYSTKDSTFIIVDFGFARHLGSSQDKETIIRTEYMDYESVDAQDYTLNDLAQFSRVLLKILDSLSNQYDRDRYNGIKSVLERAKHQNLKERYRTARSFYEAIKPFFLELPNWKFQLEMNEYLCDGRFGKFCSRLRIPVTGSVLMTEEILKLIDCSAFQRLRGIKQLGPTIFVFPGANHTRYEHSIGCCSMAMRYIGKLITQPLFRMICEPIDETIRLIVLSALFHDIGHYPYSHWIEEIDELPNGIELKKHEDRAMDILTQRQLKNQIVNEWGIKPEDIAQIISGLDLDDRAEFVNSFIDSAIDVDKLDYLVRDSIHCGVPYGEGIDIYRLLDSLYVNSETKKLALTHKGLSSLLSLLTCRNIMYQEVYWHKTVRSCDAMFKRFFYEIIARDLKDMRKINKYMDFSDDHFIAQLYSLALKHRTDSLVDLIAPFALKGRTLYKPLIIYSRANASHERINTKKFFSKIISDVRL